MYNTPLKMCLITKVRYYLMEVFRTDLDTTQMCTESTRSCTDPKIIFSDASLLLHRGPHYYKPFGTGMLVITKDGYEISDHRSHVTTELKKLTEHNSQKETNNMNLIEIQGILDVMNSPLIRPGDNLLIYCDNESTMKVFHGTQTIQKTISKYKKAQAALWKTRDDKDLTVEVRWVKGHAGIYGNVTADQLAKEAALSAAKILGHNVTGPIK